MGRVYVRTHSSQQPLVEAPDPGLDSFVTLAALIPSVSQTKPFILVRSLLSFNILGNLIAL